MCHDTTSSYYRFTTQGKSQVVILQNVIFPGKTIVTNKDNKLQNLFQPETEMTMTLNQKNALLSDDKRANLLTEIIHPSLIEVSVL